MSIKVGLVGLPNVGKSTLFNVLTNSSVSAENYPFCTIDPNVGHVIVNDDRIDKLVEIDKPANVVKSTIELYDIAGLVKGASSGEGLGNQFLANIREVDMMIHVIRCFENDKILHVDNRIDPISDKQVIDVELQLKDLETVDKKIEKTKVLMKKGSAVQPQLALLERIKNHISGGNDVRTMTFEEEQKSFVSEMQLLTSKPVVYVVNVNDSLKDKRLDDIKEYFNRNNDDFILFPIKLASELSSLTEEEKMDFNEEMNTINNIIDDLMRIIYRKLDITTFFTSGSDEVRAWTIKKDTNAKKAAGVIHSDFEKNFIKAEVCSFNNYCSNREVNTNKVRIEGKDYIVQDGDVIFFKVGV